MRNSFYFTKSSTANQFTMDWHSFNLLWGLHCMKGAWICLRNDRHARLALHKVRRDFGFLHKSSEMHQVLHHQVGGGEVKTSRCLGFHQVGVQEFHFTKSICPRLANFTQISPSQSHFTKSIAAASPSQFAQVNRSNLNRSNVNRSCQVSD